MPSLIITLIACILVLSGCSRVHIAYDWLESFIVSSLDDQFDLSRQQRSATKERIRSDKRTILQHELPGFIALLEELNVLKDNPALTTMDWEKFRLKGESVARLAVQRLEPSVLAFFQLLKPAQFAYFNKQYETKKLADDKTFSKASKITEHLLERHNRLYEFIGFELSAEQKTRLGTLIGQHHAMFHLERESYRRNFEKFITASASEETLRKWLKEFMKDFSAGRSPEYATALLQYKKEIWKLETEFLKSISPRQRRIMDDHLKTLTTDLRKLRFKEGFE